MAPSRPFWKGYLWQQGVLLFMRNEIPTSAITLDFGRNGRRIHRFDTETFGLHILPGFFRLFGQGILP
jgi:hypothetical protein